MDGLRFQDASIEFAAADQERSEGFAWLVGCDASVAAEGAFSICKKRTPWGNVHG